MATITLARGILRLARDRVIIKKLRPVETLGSTGIICTDKTGTLTENQMAARSFFFSGENFDLIGKKEGDFFQKYREQPLLLRWIWSGSFKTTFP